MWLILFDEAGVVPTRAHVRTSWRCTNDRAIFIFSYLHVPARQRGKMGFILSCSREGVERKRKEMFRLEQHNWIP